MSLNKVNSVVSYVGVSESGHCGYCKSTRRAKAKIAATKGGSSEDGLGLRATPDAHQHLARPPDNEKDGEEEEYGDSVVFGKCRNVAPIYGHNPPPLLKSNSGLIAHCLRLNSFNQLLDLGWSRSGRYLYKPLMARTCCPQYTIRLDIHKFRLSRTQKRVLKTMYNFLKYDQKATEREIVREEEAGKSKSATTKKKEKEEKHQSGKSKRENGLERQPKKKERRRKKAEERLKARGMDLEQYKKERTAREEGRRRTLQSYLEEYGEPKKMSGWKHRLEVRLVGQPSPELDADIDEEFELFRRYQVQVHKDAEDELSLNSFTRFLAASPLIPEILPEGEEQVRTPLGSYHQQYRLDGRIIAVGVIDILPKCLSAKYFFYDPDLTFLSLGTYSALREIAFTQQVAQQRPDLHFYYMGFYLFDCPKMRYKGRFRPSDLLCDHCFDWVPLAECERMIEGNGGKFATFHPSAEPDKRTPSEQEMSQIRCIFARHHLATFGQLRVALAATDGGDGGEHEEAEAEDTVEELADKVRNFVTYAGPAASEIVLAL